MSELVSIKEARKAKKPPTLAPSREPHTCLRECIRDERGRIVPNLASAVAVLRAPEFRDMLAFDEMRQTSVICAALPKTSGAGLTRGPFPREILDTDVSRLQEWMQHIGMPKISRETTHQAIDQRAEESRFHPLRRELDSLRWDNNPRIFNWLPNYLGTERTDYTQNIGMLFLISMVARVYQPGCKADYMLVLEGEQGAGKSRACRILAGEYFSDALPDIHEKDALQHLRGKWLIEIAELSAIGKADAEALKAFVSRSEEKYRPPYGRKEVMELRQCIFVGTTNKDVYLKDETGARRFWPVRVGRIDLDALRTDRDQLLSEAVARFKKGAIWWPDAQFEAQHIKPEQSARFEVDAWEQLILEHVCDADRVQIVPLAQSALGLEANRVGTSEQRRITAILTSNGWKVGRTSRGRYYSRGA